MLLAKGPSGGRVIPESGLLWSPPWRPGLAGEMRPPAREHGANGSRHRWLFFELAGGVELACGTHVTLSGLNTAKTRR